MRPRSTRRPCTAWGSPRSSAGCWPGASWQTALTYAIAVLIITCPCALALAVPAVQIAAASRLFRRRIIVKAADGLERIAETDMVVFDKTGTLTLGRPELLDDETISDDALAAAVGPRGREPASLRARHRRGGGEAAWAAWCQHRASRRCRGAVLSAVSPKGEERLGSAEWCGIDSGGEDSEVWYRRGSDAPVRFRFDDSVRSDAADVVAALKRQGYRLALLSGDRMAVVEQDRARASASRPGAPS